MGSAHCVPFMSTERILDKNGTLSTVAGQNGDGCRKSGDDITHFSVHAAYNAVLYHMYRILLSYGDVVLYIY